MSRGTRLILGLLAAVLCVTLMLLPKSNPAVAAAERINRDVAITSTATYVSLRAINAALSTAQEVELGGSVVVTGNLQPLKWLEPVDDTVERVADVIFAVAVLSGLLSLSLGPLASIGFALIALGLLGRCGCEAGKGWPGTPGPMRRLISSCGGIGLILAIGVPLAFALGAFLGEVLTRPIWVEADATLARIADEARALIGEPADAADDRGWRESITAYFSAAGLFWSEADDLLQSSLQLAGVFLLRTLVLPGVLLLAILVILRRTVSAQ